LFTGDLTVTTQNNNDGNKNNWLDSISKIATIAVGIFAAASVVSIPFGGFQSGTKTSIDELKGQLATQQTTSNSQYVSLGDGIQKLQDRLDKTPRADDIANIQLSIARIEGQVAQIQNDMRKDEIEAASVKSDVTQLKNASNTPLRLTK
jgi:hypothetical protein